MLAPLNEECVTGLAMLLAERQRHPDHGRGIGVGCIGDELTEVAMVSWCQLVLYHEYAVVGQPGTKAQLRSLLSAWPPGENRCKPCCSHSQRARERKRSERP